MSKSPCYVWQRNEISIFGHLAPIVSPAVSATLIMANLAELSEPRALTFDIYPPLFDGFFSSEEFNRWCEGGIKWRLHCSGGPGCGKVRDSRFEQ
jgi:hypothetical protein